MNREAIIQMAREAGLAEVTDTNQKLREALQVAEAALSDIGDADREPGDDLAWCERRAAQSLPLIRQALALPTADHEQSKPSVEFDLGETSSHTVKCVWSEWDAKANKLVLCLSVRDIETVAPVGERDLFERWAKDNAIRTDLGAWDAWQARAALSAGDAVDAQRYRWLMDNCTLGIKQNGVGWSLNTSACVAPDCIKDVGDAIDAAMRKAIP